MADLPNQGDAEARETVIAAIMGCRKRVPYLGRTIDAMRLQFDPSMAGIACTDSKVLRVNPERFAAFTPGERVGIIAHEALHKLLRHNERFPQREWPDHDRVNAAADYAINGWLLGACFELPEDALYDAQFDGLGARDIYYRLPSSPPPPPAWGGFGDDGKPDASPEPDGEVPAEAEAAGLGPLMQQELGLAPRSSKFSLERILTKLLVTEPLWERTYHRASHACEDLPSHIEIDRRPRVCLGLDVSGSIRQEIREIFLGVSSKIETPVTAFALDTQMQGIWRNVSRNNWQQFADELPKRGGGTLFQPAIDFAASERASLVYLTDGETSEQSLASRGVPITWLIWGNSPARRVMQPVGRLIMVETGI